MTPAFDAPAFRARIAAAIDARYLLRWEAAAELHINGASFSRILNGKSEPSVEQVYRICRWLDVSPGEFARDGEGRE